MRVYEVFVAGGHPSVTYVPRGALGLEAAVREYLDVRFKILSVSGPTKVGKTVLVRTVIPQEAGVWVSGGHVDSEETFWAEVLAQTEGFTEETHSEVESSGTTEGRQLDASVGIPGFGGGVQADHQTTQGKDVGRTKGRTVTARAAAIRSLHERGTPLVIDDFHYVAPDLQLRIVRSLKEPVYNGLPVILLSVPHRAFDAVRVEREMTGRVEQLPVSFWGQDELAEIANKGFAALGVQPQEGVVERLIAETFSSPHLMQDFCGDLCRRSGITETADPPVQIQAPTDWDEVFRNKASGTSKAAFDRLATGPRQRTDRIQRRLKGGATGDIYVAVLYAIAKTGPLTELRYEELRATLREVLTDAPPQAHEITRVLEQMSRIAKEEIEGEPVVDWDKELSTLHIADPFFAYFLRWGTELP